MTHRTRAVSASRGQGLEQGPAAGWGGVSGKRGVRFGLLPQRGPPARLLPPAPAQPQKPSLGRDLLREMPAKRWSPVMRQ